MEVILQQFVENLGKPGDVVKVRAGFARNYLIPRGLAAPATPKHVRKMQHVRRGIESAAKKALEAARALAAKIGEKPIPLKVKVGEQGKLYGSVTVRDIEEALGAGGITVDRRAIHLPEPIKALGDQTVEIRLHPEVTARATISVVAQ
ncbi:MAG: 50S ribosomal protein L9 [Nitrospirae bacterium]|nr:50S ribosomal protein L9 [Nitrospirota bacterium]